MNFPKEKLAAGINTVLTVLLLSLFSAVSYGQGADTKNLLKSWDGGTAPAEEVNVKDSVGQTVLLDQKEAKAISFSAESKAENVTGEADVYYSIYINITYADGTKKDGVNCLFKTGTHDWEKSESSFTPDKPVKSLQYHLLFRNRSGKAWFRNATLTEGKIAPTAAPANAGTPQGVKLEAAVPFTVRDGLPNVAAKLKAGEAVNVVFLGGSITVGGASPKGYVTFVVNWLKEQYPKATINLVNSGISGTGSDFGDRRYDRDVLSKNPDLVLIEFCVNDGDNDRTESMERMVHKTWMKNPKTDLLIFYTLDKRHMDYYKDGKMPPSASAHERVAAFYGIPSLGTAFNAASKILSGEIPWETFSRDGCHPTQEGYVYFDMIFEKALPECMKVSPSQAHLLDKSITPKLRVYPPPIVTAPLEFKGEFVTPKGEKAIKVYPLPIPVKNWIKEPAYAGDDGKPLWRLSWMPREFGGKLDASVGADKTRWETGDMVWFEGDGCFTGLQGQGLFKRHGDNSTIGVNGREIGIIRFIAPTTGRYAVSVKSGPWGCWQNEDKSMSFSILKFTWKGGPGESLAFHKEVKKESKGIAMSIETSLLAGEELAFVPDVNANTGDWTSFRIVVGLLATE